MIPFAGSDFWLCDLGLEFFHWPEQKVLKKEFRRQSRLHGFGKHEPRSVHQHAILAWYAGLARIRWASWKAYAYDSSGNKLKNFYPKNFEKVNGQYQLESMVMENLQTGSKSVMEFDLDK